MHNKATLNQFTLQYFTHITKIIRTQSNISFARQIQIFIILIFTHDHFTIRTAKHHPFKMKRRISSPLHIWKQAVILINHTPLLFNQELQRPHKSTLIINRVKETLYNSIQIITKTTRIKQIHFQRALHRG